MLQNYKSENEFVKTIIESELPSIGISEFFIQSRVKSKESIQKKELKKELKKDRYGHHKEITDHSGVRIIVDRLQSVRRCIEFITSRFKIDYRNSNFNALSFTDEKEFGYQSSHIIIITNDLKTEIQIRTLAQHIWASTSHTLEYKLSVKDSVFSRKLFRLSGLLEQVDIIMEDLYESFPKQNQISLQSLGQLDHYSLEYYLSRKERLFSIICVGFEEKRNSGYGTRTWPFSMKILDGGKVLGSNYKEALDLVLIVCKQLEINSIESLRTFLMINSKFVRKITKSYKNSTSYNYFVPYTMRLFYFLVSFIPYSNIEELLSDETNPGFIMEVKDFVRDCSNNINE